MIVTVTGTPSVWSRSSCWFVCTPATVNTIDEHDQRADRRGRRAIRASLRESICTAGTAQGPDAVAVRSAGAATGRGGLVVAVLGSGVMRGLVIAIGRS